MVGLGVLVFAATGLARSAVAPEITSPSVFTVREGTTAVATLAAADDDTEVGDLEWSKAGGDDADKFSLTAGGVLAFSEAKDYENPDDQNGDGVYEVTVQVSDGTDSDAADISVTLENAIELTTVTGPATVAFPENTATRVGTFAASSDDDRHDVEWTLSGDDAALFTIDTPPGVLRFDVDPVAPNIFSEPPSFEAPVDNDSDNDYELTLQATVGAETTATFDVTVTVTDQDEAGTIKLSPGRPAAGSALTATLSDPDGVTANTTTWKWERSVGRNRWAVIDDATTGVYTPTAADTNAFLRVTATYDDEHDTGHAAQAVTFEVVTGPLLTALSATTADSAADASRRLFPAFNPGVLHYGIGCETAETMTVTASAPAGARVAVDGVQTTTSSAATVVPVGQYSDVEVTVSDATGAHTVYVVHCLTDIFFDFTTTTAPTAAGKLDGLLLFGYGSNFIMMDYNGVPRYRRFLHVGSHHVGFYRLADGDFRYSFWELFWTYYAILDEDLKQVRDSVRVVSPLVFTDIHDFEVMPDGNYLLMSYHPARRDFTHLSFAASNATAVATEDSAIQIVTPKKKAVFTWISWDHMALEDCVQHYFPFVALAQAPPDHWNRPGYAHINSIQSVNGQIVASFRGCSKVLAIDTETGDVAWRVGLSNLSDEQWAERNIGPAPMTIVNDPLGQFCGQHTARIVPNGNLVLYDNGAACLLNPWTNQWAGRAGEDYSRAVEYALDFENNEAVYVREHSLHGQKNVFLWSSGRVVPLDSGDWLISWGRVRDPRHTDPPDATVTRVDPSTGQEKFEINFTDAFLALASNGRSAIHAMAVPAEALANQPAALTAAIAADHASAGFTGTDDTPTVVIAFNRPVVDFDHGTPSVTVTGATITSLAPYLVAGAPAHAYLLTLNPSSTDPITVNLLADQACADGGICAADGTQLSKGLTHTIPLDVPSEITVTVTERPPRTTSGVGGGVGVGGGGGGGGGGVVAPPGASDVFSDVPSGAWYESAVTWMIDNDVTRGCTATMFCPQASLTRQQFVTFLWRAAGQPTPEYAGSEAFSDVEEGVYSDLAIGWAVANNVTRGCTPGTFGDGTWRFCPTQHVTRGEMATLLYRHVEATYVGQPPHHVDVEPDAFYTIPIGWLTDFSVVPGCDLRLWCPNRAATRAEAAVFINGIAIRPHLWGPNNTNFTPQ